MPDDTSFNKCVYRFTLDFRRPTVKRLQVVNGDTANQFVIDVADDGNAVTLSSTLHKVVAVFTRADGAVYTQDANSGLSFDGSTVTIDVRSSSFRTGSNRVKLQVYKRANTDTDVYDLLLTTHEQNFNALAQAIPDAGAPNAPSQLPMLEQIICDAGEAVANCISATTAANAAATAADDAANAANDAATDADHAAQEAYVRGEAAARAASDASSAASSATSAASSANTAAAAANAAAAAATAAAKKNFYNVKHDTDTWDNGRYQTYTEDTGTELAAIAVDSVFASQVELPSGKPVTVYETHRHNDTVYFRSGVVDGQYVTATMVMSSVSPQLEFYLHNDEMSGAGIFDATYTTIFDTASATTSIHSNKTYPWVQISSTENQIAQNNIYRVTFDGVEYTLNADMWYADNRNGKSASLLGNATYWGDIDGFLYPINNVPFLVTGLMSDGNTNTEGIFLFTESAGTHTIKIELVSYDFNKIPPLLISGFPHLAVHLLNNGSTGYNAISVGENIMKHLRSTFAVGSGNDISAQLGIAFGQLNKVSGEAGKAFGRGNTVSGAGAVGIGENNTASGAYSVAIGRQNTSSENSSTALGYYNTASGGYATAGGAGSTASGGVSTAIGYGVVANHLCQTAIGCYNEADPSTANAGQRGNYIEIVGNGTGANARSNARTLDWDGNEALAGDLTLGKGSANEATLTAALLKALVSGGSTGQVLTRTANGFEWAALPVYSEGVS